MGKARRGEITVFLSLILICVCGLVCGLLESARTAAARCYLQTAAFSAMDSLFSQYHRTLWEEYRIFGLEHLNEEEIEEEFSGFISPYLEQENWYPFSLEECQLEECLDLTDGSGTYFLREIVEYMKYGIWTKEWNQEGVSAVLEQLKEAEEVSQLSREMELQTKSAWKLEKALEDLDQCLKEQQDRQKAAAAYLYEENGRGFLREADKLKDRLREVLGLVEQYEKQADAFGKELDTLEASYQEKQSNLSEEMWKTFGAELEEYRSYTDADGERRGQIRALLDKAQAGLSLTEDVCRQVKEVQEYIDSWEPEDEEDELDESALWRPVQRHFSRYSVLSFPVQAGVQDKKTEGLLNKLRTLMDRGMLSLVLPDGAKVSQNLMDRGNLPSGRTAYAEEELESNILEKALTAEYCQVFLRHFCSGEEEPAYEMEYVLFGQEIDEDNLARTAEALLVAREGMNLIHILGDGEKRSQARTLAASVVGASGILPLVSITAFLIMVLWAFGEAVADVKTLLGGGKVPLVKSREEWKLSLEGLLDFASRSTMEIGAGEDKGLNYEQYLTIFLMACPHTQILYRTMDVMERNISQEQPGFRLDDCAYQVDISVKGSGKHVYFSLGLWKSLMGEGDAAYPLTIKASRAY